MRERPAKAALVAICRICCVFALAAALAGCDKCGDWYSPFKLHTESCKDEAPRPQ